MPIQPTYPGVYIEEIPSGVRTLTGVATSVTAFIGRAQRGPVNEPVLISSFDDYERIFGGLWVVSDMSYAVSDFFLNGGGQAVIVRVVRNSQENTGTAENPVFTDIPAIASAMLTAGVGTGPELMAAHPGAWGNNLVAYVDYDTADDKTPAAAEYFNLTLVDRRTGTEEKFRNVLVGTEWNNHARYLPAVLENHSGLVRMADVDADRPDETTATDTDGNIIPVAFSFGNDSDALRASDYKGGAGSKTGLYALEKADIFNLLCIPDSVTLDQAEAGVERGDLQPQEISRAAHEEGTTSPSTNPSTTPPN